MNKTNKLKPVTKKLQHKKGGKAPSAGRKRSGRSPLPRPFVLASVLILILLAGALFAGLLDRKNATVEAGAAVPEGARFFCIDISHHNGDRIVWDSLRVMTDKSGRTVRLIEDAVAIRPVSAVYMKATEGENFRDRQFERNWQEAEAHGLRRGAYHFFSPLRDPRKQAHHFIRTVGELSHGDLPPVLDVETFPKGCTKAQLNERVGIWLTEVENRYGKRPFIYAPESYVRDLLSTELTRRYPVWIAHYGVDAPTWPRYRMWQFTDRAVIHGIPGWTDLSVINQLPI